jgi:hypothetical protein
MTYNFTDLSYGETFDRSNPFFLALGPNVLTTTMDELLFFSAKISNQVRRLMRQKQIEAMRNDKK